MMNKNLDKNTTRDWSSINSAKLASFTIEHAPDAIYWMTPDARIIFANRSASQMLGYTIQELCSLRITDINPHFDKESWAHHWKRLKQKQHFTIESEHRTKDGRLIPVEISINHIEFEGQEFNCAIIRDISERKRADREKAEARTKELQLIATMEGQELESQRIARDLHDSLGQQLGAAKLRLEVLKNSSQLHEEMIACVSALESAIIESNKEVQRIARNLSPVVLEDFGLEKALESLVDSLGYKSGPAIKFYYSKFDKRLPKNVELGLYRIAQEAIGNSIKHSGASNINVQLIREQKQILMTVEDDGHGFELSRLGQPGLAIGMGMNNLCNRTCLLNGRIDIDTVPQKGTTVIIKIPIDGETLE